MKRLIILLYLLLTIGTLHSQEGEFGISFGVLGIGLDAKTGISDGYFYGRVLTFMYQTYYGFGFSISPFVFFCDIKNENYFFMTFVNMSIDYNFLHEISNRFILGPFASLNALQYGQPTFFEFRSGFKFSLLDIFDNDGVFHNELFIVELGYKYNKIDKNSFFATIGFDMLLVFTSLGSEEKREVFPDGRDPYDPYNPNPERKY